MENDDQLSQLRKTAEQFLMGQDTMQNSNVSEVDIKKLFQELQVHQIELEMQNDELQRTNEELEVERLRFSGIYDLAPIGYFILSRTGEIKEVNVIGAELLGLYKHNIVGQRMQTFIVSNYYDVFRHFFNQMLQSGSTQKCQVKISNKAKEIFDVQMYGVTINPASANKRCYIAVIDITERIAAEDYLAETKNRLQLALEASHAGTWEYDLKTGYFSMDNAGFKICGLDKDIFDGNYQTFINIIHPEDQEKVDTGLRTAVNHEKELNVDSRIFIAGKICYIAIRGHVVGVEDNKKRFLGTMMDITHKKILEEETAQLKIDQNKNIAAAILQTEENERRRISESLHDSVSQLLYGIKLSLQQLVPDDTNKQALSDVHSLINQAVKETRNISFELAPSILTDFGLAITIQELAKRLSNPQLNITTRFSGLTNRLGIAIEMVIFRVVQELLNNCIKHSGATEVVVEIKKNKLLEVTVTDNGRGFNLTEQIKLPGGSGISSIKNRLDFYNGTMAINSQPGQGTSVHIGLKL